eukprot:CAMPEP_0172835204 /NCGR_PEP_ID=MMETSP1075-20121228/25585_1 /TAXON_ID=2916 /ORGANISM="Ceratium fusus, Strain PA161109" /LENGTH=42 /DNA_ID= /DNA_START= /DNA_END= /DNA_ORIENTATION=
MASMSRKAGAFKRRNSRAKRKKRTMRNTAVYFPSAFSGAAVD